MAQENFQLFKIVSISVVYTNISSFEQGYVYLTRYLFSTLKRYPPPPLCRNGSFIFLLFEVFIFYPFRDGSTYKEYIPLTLN